MAITDTVRLSKNISAQWSSLNPILAHLEIGYEVDTKLFKVGDGQRHYNQLPYVVTGAPNALFIFLSNDPNNYISIGSDGGIYLSKETFNAYTEYTNGKEQGSAAPTPPDEYKATILNIGKDVHGILSQLASLNNKTLQLEGRPLSIEIKDNVQEITSTWSSTKIADKILEAELALKTDITNNANGAYDALVRLADLLENNSSLALVVTEELANTIRFNEEQNLTSAQKAIARNNIEAISAADIGDLSDLESKYETELLNFSNSPFFESVA